MILKLLLPFLFFSIELFSQNLDSLQSQITQFEKNLLNKKQELDTEQLKHQSYLISGEIRDIDEYYLMIYGSALPTNDDYSSPGTVINNFFHLFVKPNKENITYNYYQGIHYYLFRKDGYKIFGDLSEQDQEIISNIKTEVSQLENKLELLKENFKTTQAVILIKQAKEQTVILIKQAKEKLNENNYKESISLLLKAKNSSTANKEIAQLLFGNYLELAKNDSANKNYASSLSNINSAIQLNNLTNQQYDELKRFHSQLCIQIADINFDKGYYSDAVSYYSQSIKYSEQNINFIRQKYSESYLYLGNNELSNGNVEQAKNHYKNSFEINRNMLPKIKSKLKIQQKSSLLLGLSSIIPGLGQFIQGDSKSGLTHFGIFSGSLIGGFILKTTADNEYNDYKNATHEDNAVRLYDEANTKLNYSYALFGLGGAVIIYSIIDSFTKSEKFNDKYEINFENSSEPTSISYENFSITIKLFFCVIAQ